MNGVQDNSSSPSITSPGRSLPGQIVLVLQGGGALGAYQAGVYQALHEAGIEPDWVIGTSIGAINASLIAGNEPQDRLACLREFWKRVEQNPPWDFRAAFPGFNEKLCIWSTITHGVPGFFRPNPFAHAGDSYVLGPERAGYYSTAPLQRTLEELVDFNLVNRCRPRLTVGAAHSAAIARFPSVTCWLRARCHRRFRRYASRASSIGTAAFSRTRRPNRCSTTTRARIR